jgi:hypothetical protein
VLPVDAHADPRIVVVSHASPLAAALRALVPDPDRVRHVRWPREPLLAELAAADVVVVDLATHHQERVVAALAGRHRGWTVLLLDPGEDAGGLPADPRRVALRRPFPVAALLDVIAATSPGAASYAQAGR